MLRFSKSSSQSCCGVPLAKSPPAVFWNLVHCRNFRVSAEETIWLPLRTMIAVGALDEPSPADLFIFRSRGKVDRVIPVIGGRVIALGEPVLEKFPLGSAGLGSNAHHDRRYSVADEIVLIAAGENITQWLGIGLHPHAKRLRNLAHPIAEIGFGAPAGRETFER